MNVKGYRFAVGRFIPRIAYAVTLLNRHKEPPVVDSPELQRLTAELSEVARKNHWDDYRRHAGIGTYTLAGLLYILPKVGPLKLVAVKGPTVDTDQGNTCGLFYAPQTRSTLRSGALPHRPPLDRRRRRLPGWMYIRSLPPAIRFRPSWARSKLCRVVLPIPGIPLETVISTPAARFDRAGIP